MYGWEDGPDILQDLFGNYVPADLNTAGASPEAMRRLMDGSDPDIAGRFEGIREAWDATQFTGIRRSGTTHRRARLRD